MTENIQFVVVGAGIVGIAIAREIALLGKEVLLLECEENIGTGISSRSSEVIHSGVYYPKGSLKAKLCVQGRELLYEFCNNYHVPFRKTGKLIVATNELEKDELGRLKNLGTENGVKDIELLGPKEILKKESELISKGGLYIPETGIVDTHTLMLALLNDLENHNSVLALRSPFISANVKDGKFQIQAGKPGDDINICSNYLINAAGLNAQSVAKSINNLSKSLIPDQRLSKGSYFSLGCKAPFDHLVYPIPNENSLGIHYTLALDGRARFGPNHEWASTIEYSVNPELEQVFSKEIKRYWPNLPDGALQPAYSGIRPKILSSGKLVNDFIIQTKDQHGVKGLVNLFGLESPGLTAALAIAKSITSQLKNNI